MPLATAFALPPSHILFHSPTNSNRLLLSKPSPRPPPPTAMTPAPAPLPPRTLPVLFLDVMDTIVRDPFSDGMYAHLGFATQSHFLSAKKDGTWLAFEAGRMSEEDLRHQFFSDDDKELDLPSFKAWLKTKYEFLPGMEHLLRDLREDGVELHAFSNYPIWYLIVEEKLRLSRHGVNWTFVSCCEGLRKPDLRAYQRASQNANAELSLCVLLDDRQDNCDAALAAGWLAAVKFENAKQAKAELAEVYASFITAR